MTLMHLHFCMIRSELLSAPYFESQEWHHYGALRAIFSQAPDVYVDFITQNLKAVYTLNPKCIQSSRPQKKSYSNDLTTGH